MLAVAQDYECLETGKKEVSISEMHDQAATLPHELKRKLGTQHVTMRQ